MSIEEQIDKIGIGGSIFASFCCLGVSAFVSVVSAIGLGFLIDDAVLLPLLVVFLGITLFGLAVGYRRHHGYEPEVGPTLAAALEAEGVHIITNARVHSVRADAAGIIAAADAGDTLHELRAEKILVATGRRPNSDQIAVERSGVELGPDGHVRVDEQLRTNVPHIFAAGDVIGQAVQSQMATPVGSQDGGIAAQNALAPEEPTVDHRVIPRAIFTDPQVAVVGMTEQHAVAAGHPCWCRALPLSLVPRAGAIRDTRGMVKMVANARTDEVLGVSMVGPNAAEVIHEAAMALRFRAKLRDFIDLLHVYPTMAESRTPRRLPRRSDQRGTWLAVRVPRYRTSGSRSHSIPPPSRARSTLRLVSAYPRRAQRPRTATRRSGRHQEPRSPGPR
jgi:hypothetical protein